MCLIMVRVLKYLSACLPVTWSFRPFVRSSVRLSISVHPFALRPSILLSVVCVSLGGSLLICAMLFVCVPCVRIKNNNNNICLFLLLSVCFTLCLSPCLSECPFCLPVCLPVCLHVCPSVCSSVILSISPFVILYVRLSVPLSTFPSARL